jgi:hypothetical protein
MQKAGADRETLLDMQFAMEREKMQRNANYEKQILDLRMEAYQSILGSAQSIFSDLYEVGGEKMKAFFYLEKAVAMAEALVSAWSASAKALDSPLTKTSPYLALAMSKMILATGLARAAMIGSIMLKGPGAWQGGYVKALRRRHGGPVAAKYMEAMRIPPSRGVQAFALGGNVLKEGINKTRVIGTEVTRMVGTTIMPRRDPSGRVRGPKGRDVIPAWLTDNEYVIRPEAVQQPGALAFLEMFNRGLITMKDLMNNGVTVTRDTVIREVHGPTKRFAEGGHTGGGGRPVGGAQSSLSVTVPVNVDAGGGVNAKALVSDLQDGIERTVVRIIKEHL